MKQKNVLMAFALLLAVIFAQTFVPSLQAQAAAAPPPTADQLDQLLAPVALYPDSLLAQITTASTDPQEILDVDNWLQANSDLTGTALTDAAQAQGFDPAFIALVNFPQVIRMMAENVDDYAAIGDAFTADQASVSASIQRLRAQAYASGALQTNSQMQVEVQQPAAGQTVYVIQPASPQIVYVPQYDPAVVYVGPGAGGPAPLIAFGAGIAIGALLVDNRPWGWGGWGWNWGSHQAYYNRSVWAGWGNPYRPPNYWYRPRPVRWTSRPGYGGNWRYRPPNYRPPTYPGNRPGTHRPWGPNNRPTGYRPAQPRPGSSNPSTGRPKPGNSNRPNPSPGNKPAPKPTTGRPQPKPGTTPQPKPGTTRPTTPRPQPDKSQPKPVTPQPKPVTPRPQPKPATPRPQPQTPQPKPSTPKPQPQPKPVTQRPRPQPKPAVQRPQPQPKPAPQSKPAPKSQPSAQPQLR